MSTTTSRSPSTTLPSHFTRYMITALYIFRRRFQRCFTLIACTVLLPALAKADVTITAPGPGVQVTNPVPLFAKVISTGAPITNVQVLDGSTQLGSYAGNGTSEFDVHGVYPLSTGSQTLTVKGTDSNNVTYTATQTFTVAGNGSVTQTPASNSENPSPVNWQATCTANAGHLINTVKLYLDFNPVEIAAFRNLSSNSVTESQSFGTDIIPAGSHSLTTNCWDDSSLLYQSSIDFTVGTAFQAAPGNAIPLNLDNPSSGWQADAGKSGTTGGDAPVHTDTYPATPTSGFPTLDNDSRNFLITVNDGATFQGFIWSTSFSNTTGFTSGHPVAWIYDYYVSVSNPLNPDYALEFDGNQTAGAPTGEGYVLGTECNYGTNPLSGNPTIWRFWDGNLSSGHGSWNDIYNGGGAITCPLTSSGHWYHVQIYLTVDTSTYTYTIKNIRVKDTTTNNVVQDSATAFTFKGTIDSHGNSIDIQEDGNNNHTYSATYDKLMVIRW